MDDSSKTPQSKVEKNSSHLRRALLAVVWPTFALFATSGAVGLIVAALMWAVPSFEQVIFGSLTAQFVLTALINVLALFVIVVPFFRYFFKKGTTKREVLGLTRRLQLQDLGLVFLAFGAYFVTSTLLISIADSVLPFVDLGQPQELGISAPQTAFEFVVIFIMLVGIAPLAEELIFRGFMFKVLRRSLSFWPAAILVSVAFGIAHGQWNVGIDVFALSIFLCALREYTGSLWASILLHAAKNLLAFTILFVFPDLIAGLQ